MKTFIIKTSVKDINGRYKLLNVKRVKARKWKALTIIKHI